MGRHALSERVKNFRVLLYPEMEGVYSQPMFVRIRAMNNYNENLRIEHNIFKIEKDRIKKEKLKTYNRTYYNRNKIKKSNYYHSNKPRYVRTRAQILIDKATYHRNYYHSHKGDDVKTRTKYDTRLLLDSNNDEVSVRHIPKGFLIDDIGVKYTPFEKCSKPIVVEF